MLLVAGVKEYFCQKLQKQVAVTYLCITGKLEK